MANLPFFCFPWSVEIREAIPKAIARARKRKGMSQTKLAEAIGEVVGHGVDTSMISDWETGKNLPRIDLLVAAAKVLGTSVDELLIGEEAFAAQVARQAVEQARLEFAEELRRLERRIDELPKR